MNGKSKGKRSRRRKMLSRLMALPPERRSEDVKNQCGNLRHKMERKWDWETQGNPHSSTGSPGGQKRKGKSRELRVPV